MAVIRETFVLEDRFSAAFASYLDLGRQIAANMRAASDTQDSFTAAAAEKKTTRTRKTAPKQETAEKKPRASRKTAASEDAAPEDAPETASPPQAASKAAASIRQRKAIKCFCSFFKVKTLLYGMGDAPNARPVDIARAIQPHSRFLLLYTICRPKRVKRQKFTKS